MKTLRKLLAVALLVCLCAGGAPALAAGLKDPNRYLGSWAGGEDYGEAREYYLEIHDYADGVFTLSFDIYRIWSFDDMTALVMEDAPSAVLSTGSFDQYSVLGTLDFEDDAIDLLVLDSDYEYLLPDTRIRFGRAKYD